jgi:hypothetical protein
MRPNRWCCQIYAFLSSMYRQEIWNSVVSHFRRTIRSRRTMLRVQQHIRDTYSFNKITIILLAWLSDTLPFPPLETKLNKTRRKLNSAMVLGRPNQDTERYRASLTCNIRLPHIRGFLKCGTEHCKAGLSSVAHVVRSTGHSPAKWETECCRPASVVGLKQQYSYKLVCKLHRRAQINILYQHKLKSNAHQKDGYAKSRRFD